MFKRVGKILFVFVIVIGLLTAGLLIWITSSHGSKTISAKVRDYVSREFGLVAEFGNIDLEFFPPRLALRDLVASDKKGHVHCTIEEAELAPDVLNLFAGDLTIEEIYLGSPNCRVSLDAATIDKIEKLIGDDKDVGAGKGFDLKVLPRFEVLAVSDGAFSVTVDDSQRVGRARLEVDGLGLDITSDEAGIEARGLIKKAHGTWDKDGESVDEHMEDLEIRAAISSDAIDIRHASVSIAGATLSARDAHIPVPMWPQGPSVADLSFEVPLEILNRLPVDLPTLKGTAGFLGQASVRKKGDGKPEISARGRVHLEGGKVDDFVIGDLEGLVSTGPQGVAFSQVGLRTAQGKLVLDGNIAFDEKLSADIQVGLHGIELARLMENVTFDGAYVTQKMTGTIHVTGQLNPLKLDANLKKVDVADHTVFSDSFRKANKDVLLHISRGSVSGKVKINDKLLIAKNLQVHTGNTHVSVDLKFNLDGESGWELTADSKRFDLDDVKKIIDFDVSGKGTVHCRISDPVYGDPRITGKVSFANMSFSGFDFDHVRSSVLFRGQELVFNDLTVRSGNSLYVTDEVNIDIGGREGVRVEAKVEARGVAIRDLARSFHIDMAPYGSPSGYLYGKVAIDYTMNPDNFRLEGALDHDELTILGERFGSNSFDFLWENGQLIVNHLDLDKGKGTISITGAVMRNGSLNFLGVARNVDLSTIDYPLIKDLGLSGTGQVFAVIDGTMKHPTGRADVRLSELVYNGRTYGASHLELELDDKIVLGRGSVAGRLLTLEHGRIDIETERFEVEAFAYDVDLVSVLGIDTRGKKAELHVTGEAALEGKLGAKPKLTGYAELHSVRFAIDDFEFKNERPVEIVARRDKFKLSSPVRFRGSRVVFDISGAAGLERISNIAIAGIADLSLVSKLVGPVKKSSGHVRFEARIKGSWDDPFFRGQADVEDGAFTVSGFPNPIEKVAGRVVLGAKQIRFQDFSATSAGGTMSMEGQMTLAGLDVDDYRFGMKLEGLELALSEDLSLKISTVSNGLVLRPGKKRNLPTVTGDIKLTSLRYTQDLKMIQVSDLSIDRLTGTKLHTRKPRILDEEKDKFAFDIFLHGDRNLLIRNNLVDANIRIDDTEEPLRLVGTNQMYGFLGRVFARKGGQVRFAGKTFDVRYAAVSFKDPLRPENPHFRVTADGQLRDWTVTVTAQGTPEEYEIKLTSQPTLSEEDLVFLLFTGMTKAEHAQFGSRGIAGIGAPILGNVGGDLIPLELRIFTEYSEKAGTDTTRVSVGKRITKDVWISVSSSLGQDRDIEANLEYKINDNFSLSANYDNESEAGNLGLDLKFRLEF